MTCNMAACYRKQPVEDKSYPVDFKAGRSFGEPQVINPVVAKQQFACKQVGHESVNGLNTEKWEMDSEWLGSGPAYLWVDSQIKTAIKWTLPDGSSGELQNIKVGAQAASLFELPADYRKQDLPH